MFKKGDRYFHRLPHEKADAIDPSMAMCIPQTQDQVSPAAAPTTNGAKDALGTSENREAIDSRGSSCGNPEISHGIRENYSVLEELHRIIVKAWEKQSRFGYPSTLTTSHLSIQNK